MKHAIIAAYGYVVQKCGQLPVLLVIKGELNGFCESFNVRIQDEFLNRELFVNMYEVQF